MVTQLIEIPYPSLDKDTLYNLVESFILREGTDYGLTELSLEEKVNRLMSQLEQGKVKIFFDEKEESCTIVDTRSLTNLDTGIS